MLLLAEKGTIRPSNDVPVPAAHYPDRPLRDIYINIYIFVRRIEPMHKWETAVLAEARSLVGL